MSELIKSVRARQKQYERISDLDLKVSIYKLGFRGSKRKVSVTDKSDNSIIGKDPIEFSTSDRYSSYTDDDFIKDYLDTLAKLSPSKSEYNIIQDPWNDKYVEPRKYGSSPYYLNDGSKFVIEWLDGGTKKFSDKDNANSLIEKHIILFPPESSNLKKYYLEDKNSKFGYSDVVGYNYNVWSGTVKDVDILKDSINHIKYQIEKAFGTPFTENKLALCNPDSETCNLIEFRDFVAGATSSPKPEEQAEKNQPSLKTTDGSKTNASGTKVKLTVNIPSDINVVQNRDMPPFSVFVGDIPLSDSQLVYRDEVDPSEEDMLDEEYSELPYKSVSEQINYNLQLETGDSEGAEANDSNAQVANTPTSTAATTGSATSTTPTTSTTSTTAAPESVPKSQAGGGTGERRFQQKKVVGGVTVFNGELPKELITKADFCGHKFEKHATNKLNELNKAFKNKFGSNLEITDGYRVFDVQNSIHDWNYFDTGKNPYSGNTDPVGKGRKKGSFTAAKPMGVAAAKPGTSAHGWGQAMDISGMGGNMPHPKTGITGYSEKYMWMWENAPKYDWINPDWAQKPGAGFEPWHWEYNGKDLFQP